MQNEKLPTPSDIRKLSAQLNARLLLMVKFLDKHKAFYRGMAKVPPGDRMDSLMAGSNPFIPFCRSFFLSSCDSQTAVRLKRDLETARSSANRLFDKLDTLLGKQEIVSAVRKSFSDHIAAFLTGGEDPDTRKGHLLSSCESVVTYWMNLGYLIEVTENMNLALICQEDEHDNLFDVLPEAFRRRICALPFWFTDFKKRVPTLRNPIAHFMGLRREVLMTDYSDAHAFTTKLHPQPFSYENALDACLTTSPQYTLDPEIDPEASAVEVSPWISLAQTMLFDALRFLCNTHILAPAPDRETAEMWASAWNVLEGKGGLNRPLPTADDVAEFKRLANAAAEREHAIRAGQAVKALPLAKVLPTDRIDVPIYDLRVKHSSQFRWEGEPVEWYRELTARRQAGSPSAPDDIDEVTFGALELYRTLTNRVAYLRGETDRRPAPIKTANGEIVDIGKLMTAGIEPNLLAPMKRVIENLPSLNTADGGYPFRRLERMFKSINLLTMVLNHSEEEKESAESQSLATAAASNLELQKLVCPKTNGTGRYVLETALIAKAFSEFYKHLCTAAWALRRKTDRRKSAKIDLSALDDALREVRSGRTPDVAAPNPPNQAEIVRRLEELKSSVRTLNTKANMSAAIEELILWYASGNDPRYKPKDGRTLAAVREFMVNEGLSMLAKDASLSERSAADILVRKYVGLPGAYDDVEALRKQLNRKNPYRK